MKDKLIIEKQDELIEYYEKPKDQGDYGSYYEGNITDVHSN